MLIANNLPYHLAASFEIFALNSPQQASSFFFTGGQFSNQSVLLAWEHSLISTTVNALLSSYFPQGGAPTAPVWPSGDYDTIWTLTFDAEGNLTVDNSKCEGIQSTHCRQRPLNFDFSAPMLGERCGNSPKT